MKGKVALLLSIVMIWGMSMQALAAGDTGTLTSCYIGISCRSDGIVLSVDTSSTTDADEIGCRDVVLTETYNGVTKYIHIGGGHTSGNYYYGSLKYPDAIKGATYSASCVHYAKWGSREETLPGSAGPIVYN